MYLLKNSTLFLVAICMMQLFTACEDVVDIKLDEAPDRLVVDGWINNRPEAQTIKLTTTAPYFEAEPTPGVSGATVSVTSSAGKVMDFVETSGGNYVWTPAAGENIGDINEAFVLSIQVNGKSYSSATILNRVPPVDSISQEIIEETNFVDERIECNFFSRDPVGAGDTYWIKTFRNDIFLSQPSEINIAYDAGFSAGSEVDGLIFIPPIRFSMNPEFDEAPEDGKIPSPWIAGDNVRVEIHSISNEAYFFLDIVQTQLLNSTNTIFAEPLSNTTGNIKNDTDDEEVLGMFVVSAVSELEYVIQ